jgi:hypothetical protein
MTNPDQRVPGQYLGHPSNVYTAGPVLTASYARSWEPPTFCPVCAGRRAVERHGEALRRLADG